MKIKSFKPRFVHRIPENIAEGTLYICMECSITIHKCACGCGEEVALPLDPKQWKLIYDGQTVSLTPSIGNWSYKCKSHYFIKNNNVIWAKKWSDDQINRNRAFLKRNFFGNYLKRIF